MGCVVKYHHVEQHAHHDKHEVAANEYPGRMLHERQPVKPTAQHQQNQRRGQLPAIGITMVLAQIATRCLFEGVMKALLVIYRKFQGRQ